MDQQHEPALRLAWQTMLVEGAAPMLDLRLLRLLHTAPWTAEVRQQILVLAQAWADVQKEALRVTLRQAFGEVIAPQEASHPPEGPLTRRREMSSIPVWYGTGKEPKEPDVMDVQPKLSEADLALVRRLASDPKAMACPPYNTPPSKLERARVTVEEDRVHPAADQAGVTLVTNRDGDTYHVTPEGCSCKGNTRSQQTRWACYHTVAVELWARAQAARTQHTQPALFAVPPTVEDRLAGRGTVDTVTGEVLQNMPREAPGRPQDAKHDTDDVQDVSAPETILAQSASSEEASMTYATPETTDVVLAQTTRTNGHSIVTPPRPRLDLRLPLRSIHAIIADLSKPLPPSCIAQKKQRDGSLIDYIHWYTAVEVLDAYAPGWRGEIRGIQRVTTVVGKKADLRSVKGWAITYRITIPCAEGEVYREAVGMEHEDDPLYGDTMTNGEATALKRTAAKFGVAADLYDKEDRGSHFTAFLRQEKAALLHLLRTELDRQGLDAHEVLAWLMRQVCCQRRADIPVSALKALIAYLGIVEPEPSEETV